ncbi:DUF397 domain-containing protein [Streptosporangium amethystogenes]|uniref:DUF397 domain-containing protein n=1 Tax=Streptosporangium amethystogenes TaxID=2002 RepID=UPI003CCBED26
MENQPVDLSHAEWRKSSRSNGNGGACVEVARNLAGIVAVRDSKDINGPALLFSPSGWRAFGAAKTRAPSISSARSKKPGSPLGPSERRSRSSAFQPFGGGVGQ